MEIREGDDRPRDKPHESVQEHNRYVVKFMMNALEKDGMFKPTYLSRLAACLLSTGKWGYPEQEDILPGVDIKEATYRVNKRAQIASARSDATRKLKEFKEAEADKVTVELFRGSKPCGRVLQLGTYPQGIGAPIYPCADCLEDDVCIIDYRAEWKD